MDKDPIQTSLPDSDTPVYLRRDFDEADEASLVADGAIAENAAELDETRTMVGNLLGEVASFESETGERTQARAELLEQAGQFVQRIDSILTDAAVLFPDINQKGRLGLAQEYPHDYIDLDNPELQEFFGDNHLSVEASRQLSKLEFVDETSHKKIKSREITGERTKYEKSDAVLRLSIDTFYCFKDAETTSEIIMQGNGAEPMTVTISDGVRSMLLTPEELQLVEGLSKLVPNLVPGTSFELDLAGRVDTGFGGTVGHDGSLIKPMKRIEKNLRSMLGKPLSMREMQAIKADIQTGLGEGSWKGPHEPEPYTHWDI